jgi:hypothetical protein
VLCQPVGGGTGWAIDPLQHCAASQFCKRIAVLRRSPWSPVAEGSIPTAKVFSAHPMWKRPLFLDAL